MQIVIYNLKQNKIPRKLFQFISFRIFIIVFSVEQKKERNTLLWHMSIYKILHTKMISQLYGNSHSSEKFQLHSKINVTYIFILHSNDSKYYPVRFASLRLRFHFIFFIFLYILKYTLVQFYR